MVGEIRRKVPDGLSDMLDMIRICSVETVESIQKWREAMVRACLFRFCFHRPPYTPKLTVSLNIALS
jgi:hypothetical protein